MSTTNVEMAGYVVVRRDLVLGLVADWDGEIHATREAADESLAEARAGQYASEGWRLLGLVELEG
jgi:regulator of RNase E activity RraA